MDFLIILAIVSIICVIVFAIYDHLILPQIAKWHVARLVAKLKEGTLPKSAPVFQSPYYIAVDENGFRVCAVDDAHPPASRNWTEVLRVTAYKRDLFTVDMICVRVMFMEQDVIELNEDMPGWQAFVEALPVHLPGCTAYDNWFIQVAFPAFETNLTTLFDRNSESETKHLAMPNEEAVQVEIRP